MTEGDTVLLIDGTQATLVKMPRSEGRRNPRALVQTLHGEKWVHVSELKEVPNASQRQD